MSGCKMHLWKFFRAGGLDQVMIRNGADIACLPFLDQKLWVALSCPTRGVEFDLKTLELIDLDKDGRVRANELLTAIRWTVQRLKDPNILLAGSGELQLSSINDQDEAGAKLLRGAKRILANLAKPQATSITLEDTADTKKIFLQTQFNGDGILPIDPSQDPAIQKLLEEIIASLGSELDRSGKPGVNQAKLDLFFTQAAAYSDWAAKGEVDPAISTLGAQTPAAVAALKVVKSKGDDYFVRCRLAAFDLRAALPLNRGEPDYLAMAPKELTLQSEEVARLPLAQIQPCNFLPLSLGINPAWAAAMAKLELEVIHPLFGGEKEHITESEWNTLKARLAPYETWLALKPVTPLEKLGLERLRVILQSGLKEAVQALIQQDAALEVENAQIKEVDQLIRFSRDLNRLLHNYVNLGDFYDPAMPAIFQIGTLYIDGRSCELCFHVDDIAKHSTFAGASKIYLAYCELVRPATGQKRTICAAFTAGFAESLWVGRNGIFYDRQKNDWDAVIIKVIEAPISLKEAFWAPWKKIASMIAEQVKRVLAAKEAATIAAASKHVDGLGKGVQEGKVPPLPPARLDGAAIASSVAAIGIAVGLLSQAAAKLFDSTRDIEVWQAVLGVVAVVLAVSGPAVVLAYFKLRARDLAPILNACGWAVNSRIRMTLRLGRVLTQEARLPAGSERQLTDPYAEDNRLRNWLLILLAVTGLLYGLWKMDYLNSYLHPNMQHRQKVVIVPGEKLEIKTTHTPP